MYLTNINLTIYYKFNGTGLDSTRKRQIKKKDQTTISYDVGQNIFSSNINEDVPRNLNYGAGWSALQVNFIELQLHYLNCDALLELQRNCGCIAV
jgi:hypothetical protein